MRAASLPPHSAMPAVLAGVVTRIARVSRSWRSSRALVTVILVAASCAYTIPVERSIGQFTAARPNASTLSSGELLAPAADLGQQRVQRDQQVQVQAVESHR